MGQFSLLEVNTKVNNELSFSWTCIVIFTHLTILFCVKSLYQEAL